MVSSPSRKLGSFPKLGCHLGGGPDSKDNYMLESGLASPVSENYHLNFQGVTTWVGLGVRCLYEPNGPQS